MSAVMPSRRRLKRNNMLGIDSIKLGPVSKHELNESPVLPTAEASKTGLILVVALSFFTCL